MQELRPIECHKSISPFSSAQHSLSHSFIEENLDCHARETKSTKTRTSDKQLSADRSAKTTRKEHASSHSLVGLHYDRWQLNFKNKKNFLRSLFPNIPHILWLPTRKSHKRSLFANFPHLDSLLPTTFPFRKSTLTVRTGQILRCSQISPENSIHQKIFRVHQKLFSACEEYDRDWH